MKKYCFGADIGGTTVKLGLFDTEGNILDKWEIKTHTENEGSAILPDTAAAILAKMEERKLNPEEVAGIGVGVPGPVSIDGIVPHTANLGWGYKEVTKELSERTGNLHARRATAHHHKCEQPGTLAPVGAQGSPLKTVEDFITRAYGLRGRFNSIYVLLQIGDSEKIIRCTGSQHQHIVRQGLELCSYLTGTGVNAAHIAHMERAPMILARVHLPSEREGNTRRLKPRRSDLIEQRREAMVIIFIYHHNIP